MEKNIFSHYVLRVRQKFDTAVSNFKGLMSRWFLPYLSTPAKLRFQGNVISLGRKNIITFLQIWQPKIQGTVLDIGVGNWAYPRELFGKTCRYISTDQVPKPTVDVVCDIYEINNKFGDQAADAILCCEVIEHLTEPWAAIANLRRTLKDGGILIVTTPFNYYLHNTDRFQDYYRFSEAGLRYLLRDFQILDVQSIGPKNFPYHYCVAARKPKSS